MNHGNALIQIKISVKPFFPLRDGNWKKPSGTSHTSMRPICIMLKYLRISYFREKIHWKIASFCATNILGFI